MKLENITDFMERINQGVDFTITQAPDVVQQLILWERTKCFIGLFLILFAGVMITIFLINIQKIEVNNDISDKRFAYIITSAIIFIISITVGIIVFFGYLSAWVAPKWHIVSIITDRI